MQLTNRIFCGLALSASLLLAQTDPPGRVARLSYMYHAVSFLPAGIDDWAPADYNRPLTTGDQIFADPTATAELQIGIAALRLGSGTALQFLNLDDSSVQLSLTQGMLLVRLRSLGGQDSFEVDTPNLAFSLTRPGEYRVEVYPDSSTTVVAVRSGEGELTGPDQAFTVHAGEQAQVAGGDPPSYQVVGVPPRGQLESWALDRDQRWDQSPSARYVSRELIGFEDLDQHGSWRNTPDYGYMWVPNGVAADWAPYHTGHWAWVDPWGWTWVDDAPWGFAPFHYGRWAYVGGAWGWVPGPIAVRPVYAPALVAWVGGGALGGGAVAWFPLGPREVYVPAYRTSPDYVTRVNVTNTVIVNNVVNVNVTNVTYVNRTAPGAVMAVQQAAFASARPVQSAAIAVKPEAIRSASIVANAAVAPSKASVVRVAAAGATVAKPSAAVQSRPVVAKRTPPPPPVPFAQKQQALATNAGRPLEPAQVQQIRQSQPAAAARPALVRQVQARPPAPAPKVAAGQKPVPAPQAKQTAPPQAEPVAQRPTPAPPAPAAQRPAPAPEAKPAAPPAPAAQRPAPATEAKPAAPPAPAAQRPVPATEAKPAAPPAPAASPSPAKEAQRPAPASKPNKSASDKKKEDDKEKKKEEQH